eukprot:gene10873-12669_t
MVPHYQDLHQHGMPLGPIAEIVSDQTVFTHAIVVEEVNMPGSFGFCVNGTEPETSSEYANILVDMDGVGIALGVCLALGGLASTLPQHIKLIKSRSAFGLSCLWLFLGGVNQFSAVLNARLLSKYGPCGHPTYIFGYSMGILSTIVTFIQWSPQIYKTFRSKSVGSFSIIMLCIQGPGTILTVYFMIFVSHESVSTWLSNVSSALQIMVLLVLLIFYNQREKRQRAINSEAEEANPDIDSYNGEISPTSSSSSFSSYLSREDPQAQPLLKKDRESIRYGHQVIALAHLLPPPAQGDYEEMDSYMYQTVGHNVIEAVAAAIDLPLIQHEINGKPRQQEEIYHVTADDEVEDLFQLLSKVKAAHPDVQVLDETSVKMHSDDAFAAVAFVSIQRYSLVEKTEQERLEDRRHLAQKTSCLSLTKWSDNFQFDTSSTPTIEPFIPQQRLPVCTWQRPTKTPVESLYRTLRLIETRKNNGNGFFVIPSYSIDAGDMNSGEILDKMLLEITDMLTLNNMSVDNLLFVNLYLYDMADFGIINQAYFKHFKTSPAARACVQVKMPANTRVIVDLVGHRGVKRTLHVQSISEWAPACIGPYSQATFIDNLVFLAGQIGLDPPTLTLVHGGVESQLRQIYLNLVAVLEPISSNSLAHTLQSIVLLKDIKYAHVVQFYLNNIFKSNKVIPLYLIAEIPAFPRDSCVEVLLLNETSEVSDDLPKNRPNQYKIEKNFHDNVKGYVTGYKGIVANQGHTSIFNFFLALDHNLEDNLDLGPIAAAFVLSIVDSLQATFQPMNSDALDHIVSIKVYHNNTLPTIDQEIYARFEHVAKHVAISFVSVGALFVEEQSNVIINTEILLRL